MTKNKEQTVDRRGFLKAGAATTAGAAAATLLPIDASAEPQDVQAPGDRPNGYRLTRHVLDYYKSAKA